jgi:hypothetical protein
MISFFLKFVFSSKFLGGGAESGEAWGRYALPPSEKTPEISTLGAQIISLFSKYVL